MRAKRARERETLPLMVSKSPAAFIFIREIDDLQGENRSTISNEKVEGLCDETRHKSESSPTTTPSIDKLEKTRI